MHGLLTARELTRPRLDRLIAQADQLGAGAAQRHPGAVIGLLFLQESLRTRAGFAAAAARLGAGIMPIDDRRSGASMMQPETLDDTIRSVGTWCDVLCLRSPLAPVVRRAAERTSTPIVNCGNGDDEHPVQALVDLYAIMHLVGRIDHVTLALVGDLSAMRTAHSLALAVSHLEGWTVRCIAPNRLGLPEAHAAALRHGGHDVQATTEMEVSDVDVVYMAGLPASTRIGMLAQEEQARYAVDRDVVAHMPRHAKVLCPLPRVDEIDRAVDELPQAGYFAQSELSLAMRMALLDEQLTLARSTRSTN